MDITKCSAYEIIEQRKISDLDSEGYLLRHKKTGAKVTLLSNQDENKVFCIGFRTPPKDSTGVAHIIEHTVLCGSKKFPVKDPFVELVKGSLNTFLNAMTYPDKTVYPVASCNDKDLQNLMDVYMDAVFYPNIYKEKKIFEQEGWHYECEGENEPITINGVVYNEMKGAFSSPDDVLDREILNALFPDTPYGVESGGDPKHIPELTYEEYLEFHKRYYHPSNSYIYLYGDMDMEEKLNWLDREYLSHFSYQEIDSEISMQKAFDKPMEVTGQYPISEGESEKGNTYLSYNTVVGTSLDKELYLAFQVLDYVLCSAPGAPLKTALIEKAIGTDVYSVYENGTLQPYFSMIAKNADADQKERFVTVIEETLEKLVKEGLRRESLLAGINYYEFKYKEADFGSYPKGLMYGLQSYDSWLYDGNAPFMHIEANATFAALREKVESDYFEQLIVKYLLQNTHKVILTVIPVKGLMTKEEEAQKEKLADYKNTLPKEALLEIIKETAALHQYQEEESSPEDLAKIPLLTREDMKKEAEPFINETLKLGESTVLFHDVFTNGVGYIRILFKIDNLNAEYLPYLSLLKAILGYVDTEHFSYGALFDEVNIQTGGILMSVNSYVDSKNLSAYQLTYEIKVKALEDHISQAFSLLQEILFSSKIQDKKRLREIIGEGKSRVQTSLMSSGHSLAAIHALASFSETAVIQENLAGITFYRLLEKLDADFDGNYEMLVQNLQYCMKAIFRPEHFMLDYTGSRAGLDVAMKEAETLKKDLFTEKVTPGSLKIVPKKRKDAYLSASQVQYVCRAGNYRKEGLSYTGALRVLKVMMGYEYLWVQVRVKGGAYGCMSSFGKTGDCYFVSYRDPNLAKTIEAYEHAAEFVRKYDADERTLTQYIIGALSEKDIPLTPSAKGSRSLTAYLTNYTLADEQKERDELLNIDAETIRGLADYIDAFMKDDCLCVVGNETLLEEHKTLFDETQPLFCDMDGK